MLSSSRAAIAVAVLCLSTSWAAAQESAAGAPTASPLPVAGAAIDGPPAPVAPATISRDANGKATVRAIKLLAPLDVDGTLDESVYTDNPPFGDLIQVVPATGQPATEKTDLWLMFDDTNIYVGARVHDSAPPEQWVANEYRRDTNQLRQNDHIGIGIDTFYDRRSGFMFYATPLASFSDYSIIDEGQPNTDWNPVWNVRTGRFPGGWTMEMIIPFKSLRFAGGRNQTWGFQVRRSIRRKNEWAYLTPAAAVDGRADGPQSRLALRQRHRHRRPAGRPHLEIKPYIVRPHHHRPLRTPPLSNDLDLQLGGDVKYGITANLVADFTYNTDFAQVEVDEQQLNLTRFSCSSPRSATSSSRAAASSTSAAAARRAAAFGNQQSATPFLFYSRRIGLNRNRVDSD